ncbi:PAS domain S-box protein [Holophaga foetida]|uniref:PAS domain S-box protein n=1 Tax=Holophaga foetida TaxID=35839 RepID=UPI00024742FD|nr:PAS domain S-box protein [Holophaga foetida]
MLHVPTLALIMGLISIALAVALTVQYRVNRAYPGIGWWMLGSTLTALGCIFLCATVIDAIEFLSMFGNPFLVAGRVCIFVGVAQFLDRKFSPALMATLLVVSWAVYYLYLFGYPNVSARTVTVSAAIALVSFMTAHLLLGHRQPEIQGSVRFTAWVFVAHGCFLLLNIYKTLNSPHIESYLQYSSIQKAAFVVPIVTSTLWTFGLILMVNQRLNADNLAEKLKLQQALDALKESEETYRSILNASPDDITITDLEGNIIIISPAANRMFGYEQEGGLRLSVPDCIVHEDRARAQSNMRLLLQGELKGPNEYRGVRKDRSTFDIEVNSGLIRGAQGQPTKLVFVVRDITERKKVELEKAELETRNRQLQKAESLSRMAGAISHHFNNKLQAVMTNLELMGNRRNGGDPGICLSRARQATEQASEVSRLMMAYLGQTSHEQAPLALSELYQGSLPLLQGALPPRVTLSADLPSPGPVIQGNGDQLQQVLISLVTNAWEAMGERGGEIRLALRTCPASAIPGVHRVPISWQPQPITYACLEVADSGPGIAEEDLDKLFDPFFSTRLPGRGMGLPVVLGIAQAHGGGLSVESRLGQGSVFCIYLPLSEEAMIRPADAAVPSIRAGRSHGTLLLVDDDVPLLETTSDLLKMMGFSVLSAKDGVEALDEFRAHRDEIRCVITDLTMPRLDGWGTLSALRQLDPALPVILTSGYDRAQVMAREHPDRPQAFLGKPFSLKQLQEAVAAALGSSR